MKRYSRAEIVAFLRRLDALLATQEVLEIVGGAAAILKYGARAPSQPCPRARSARFYGQQNMPVATLTHGGDRKLEVHSYAKGGCVVFWQ